MNKEDKTVIVSNEHGNMLEREYQDNIEEVLIEENIIETLCYSLANAKIERASLEKEFEEVKSNLQKYNAIQSTLTRKQIGGALVFSLIFLITSLFMCYSKDLTSAKLFLAGLVDVASFTVAIASVVIPKFVKEEFEPTKNYEETEKMLNVTQNNVEVLTKLLEQAQEKYQTLKEDNKNGKEPIQHNNQITEVKYKEVLEQRKLELLSMYDNEMQDNQSVTRKLVK